MGVLFRARLTVSWPLSRLNQAERIWPLSDFLGVLPHYVVLAENEQGPVDGEAVLPDRYGVVQGHGASTLRFGLLKGWGDATCGHGRSVAVPVALGPSVPRAQQAGHVVSEAGHPVGKAKPAKRVEKDGGETSNDEGHCASGDGEAGLLSAGERGAVLRSVSRTDFGRSQSAISFGVAESKRPPIVNLGKKKCEDVISHLHVPWCIPIGGARCFPVHEVRYA